MKKKTLLGSIITIVLCLSIIAGSTFALFTDTKKFNIAATSADVEIHASAGINQLYSATYAGDGIDAEDRFLIDEYKKNYVHQAMGGVGSHFLNGGTAEVVDGNLSIYRLTPGDRVDVDILIENLSDVSIIYRYKIEAKDSNLATAMVVTVDDGDDSTRVAYEGLKYYVSPWFAPVATDGNGTGYPVPTETLSFELPVYANDDFQTEYDDKTHTTGDIESVEYVITVEAVQANAKKDNESEYLLYQTEVVEEVAPVVDGGRFFADPTTKAIYVENMYLLGDTYVALDTDTGIGATIITNCVFDVNGSAIVVEQGMAGVPLTVIYDCEFTLGAGEYIVDGSNYAGYDPMIFIGSDVKVNGEYITDENVAQFFKNVGYIDVFDPNVG